MPDTATPIWHMLETPAVLETLGTDAAQGLVADEAVRRMAEHGPNELVEKAGRTLWQMFVEQVSSVLILLLLVSAGMALALGKVVDATAIFAIVGLFVGLGIVQEYRAQKAIAALKQMAAPLVRVVRGGSVQEISGHDLVPGDIVKLETGSIIPADGRLIESVNLRVQESALTGESEPVEKTVEALAKAEMVIGDRRNMAFMGTFATFGRGALVVTATGMKTELGHIATMMDSVEPEATPLQKKLAKLGRTLAIIAVSVALLITIGGLLRGEEVSLMLLTGVSLAVAIVPEGLPAVLTFTLALGARRMLRRKALVRTLPSVETLGSVTVICSDKTGTLTQNRMTVTHVCGADGEVIEVEKITSLRGGIADEAIQNQDVSDSGLLRSARNDISFLLYTGALCNDTVVSRNEAAPFGFGAVGDPTENALGVVAARFGLFKPDLDSALPRVAEVPFDSSRKLMTTVHRAEEGFITFTKGAPDNLLARCTHALVNGQEEPLTEETRAHLLQVNDSMTRQGMRVLGGAFKRLNSLSEQVDESLESGLVFLGLLGMMDPPRAEAKAAVQTCKLAGIRPVMITGDHPLTAHAIAVSLGMTAPDSRVLTGVELETMSAEDLRAVVGEVSVYARVSPEHKLKIVRALQANGEVVAMTGDGVNDAPALRQADIGVAMGTGTDVAREAANMVLLDDNFATIVAAVEEGRVVYDNIRRFIMFSVAGNIGKVMAVALPPLLGMPLLLMPIQILWANLMTDGLLGLGVGFERAESGTMRRPPVPQSEGMFAGLVGRRIAWTGPYIGLVAVALGAWAMAQGHGEVFASTFVFTAITVLQVGQAVAARTFRDSLFRVPLLSNPVLPGVMALVLALQAAVVYVPLLQPFFHTVKLGGAELVASLLLATALVLVTEGEKKLLRRKSP